MFFDKLQVTGMMKLGDKRIVTLGRLTLEPGQTLQPVIPSQTQILRVLRVEDNLLEIGWVGQAACIAAVALSTIRDRLWLGHLHAHDDHKAGDGASAGRRGAPASRHGTGAGRDAHRHATLTPHRLASSHQA